MENIEKTQRTVPPRIISSFQAGFNAAANHIYLILFPVLLDLFLWLGPRLRVKPLLESTLENWIAAAGQVGAVEMRDFLSLNQEVIHSIFTQFNLLGLINTFPIGIPSLLTTMAGDKAPYGHAVLIEISSMPEAFVLLVGLLILGLLLGSLFLSATARVSFVNNSPDPGQAIHHVVHSVILTFVLLSVLIAISIPALIVLTVIVMILPGMAQIGSLVMIFFLLWLVLPMAFSPHGIFISGQSAISSLLTSIRMIRFYLPGTGVFIVTSLLLYQGLNIIWRIPDGESWMTLVGILGHGFITCSLLSASFAYYQGGLKWMNDRQAAVRERQQSSA